jgi:signal transduction histidine kinase/ligand-binding sensor domain-containing protein
MRNVLLFLAGFGLAWTAAAQPGSPSIRSAPYFDRYGPEHGLHIRQIRAIGQTSDGFLWMASDEGLIRYDGEIFELFHDPDPPDSVNTGRFIETMVVDPWDRLWISLNTHLAVYDARKGHWHYVRDRHGSLAVRPTSMYVDTLRGRVWVGTEGGLYVADSTGALTLFTAGGTVMDRQPVRALTTDGSGHLWWTGRSAFNRLVPETGRLETYPLPATLKGADVVSAFAAGDSIVWWGTWSFGLFRLDIKTGGLSAYAYRPGGRELNNAQVIRPHPLDPDQLWVGTFHGLHAFDPGGKEFRSLNARGRSGHAGYAGHVFCFFRDRSGVYWIGGEDGLARFDPAKQRLRNLRFDDLSACFPVDNIAVERHPSGDIRLWFTPPYCDWQVYNLTQEAREALPRKLAEALEGVGVFTLFLDRQRRLWIGTNEKGLLCYDLEDDAFTPWSGKFFRQSWRWVDHVGLQANGQLWFGTFNGLFRFNAKTQDFTEAGAIRRSIDQGRMTASIAGLAFDPRGRVWGVTKFTDARAGSLFMYDPAADSVRVYDRFTHNPFRLVNDFRDVAVTRDSLVCVSTDRGLFVIDRGDMTTLRRPDDDAPGRAVPTYGLVSDKHGFLWVSTAFGVSRIDPGGTFRQDYVYTRDLIGSMIGPALWYDSIMDRVLLGQESGIDIIGMPPLQAGPVRLHRMGVWVNQQPIRIEQEGPLRLPFNRNDVQIRLALPFYGDPLTNVFRYKMEGYDDDWTTSRSGQITYNNLPFGRYRFVARGIAASGTMSENEVVLDILIRPPFWRALWFQAAVVALLSSLIFLYFKSRDTQRKRMQAMRDAIARDLHDEMGSNLSAIKLLTEYEMSRHGTVDSYNLQKILGKVNAVIDSMYEIVWSIHPSPQVDVLGRVKAYLVETLEPLGIGIRFQVPPDMRLSLDPERRRHLFLLFKEAVNNIAKYAAAREVVLEVVRGAGHVTITLRDDGQGFDNTQRLPGHGLENMRNRAEAAGGRLRVESAVGKGTVIVVSMKA